MAVFATRPVGYKIGLLCLPVLAVLFVVGYSVPYWVTADVANQYLGLWVTCNDIQGCYSLGVSDLAVYFHFVRISETVGLIMFLAAMAFGISSNFRSVAMPYSRRVETFAAMAGVWGLGGAIVFLAKYEQATTSYLVRVSTQYGYGMYLAMAASGGALLCCFLIGCNNPNPTTTTARATTSTGGQTVAVSHGMSGVVVQSAYPPPAYPPAAGGAGVYQVPPPSAPQYQYPSQYPSASSAAYPTK